MNGGLRGGVEPLAPTEQSDQTPWTTAAWAVVPRRDKFTASVFCERERRMTDSLNQSAMSETLS